MEILNVILQLILVFVGWFIITYVKKLPDQVHAKNFKKIEHDLNTQLEEFRNKLTTDLELMKINEAQLHIHKTEEFVRLIRLLVMNLTDKDYINDLTTNEEVKKEHSKSMTELGSKLFFFASDDTVKKFVEYRKQSLKIKGDKPTEAERLIVLLGELMVLIRKDLGYSQTECDKNDYLHILLNDWDKYEQKYNN
ncbi:hypothetical protein IM717_04945 [Bacillus velezensis]|uniref:hypothetical protein n=1 Tax=Bacillus TaxID=1386 RepID=UPI00050102E1|nr:MULTISPECIES: hypothetical protein [Bacillus]ARM29849.1 hypothetical protein B9C48_19320 [Bacillus vallismortis]ANF38865.1 hypothetical protein BCBMB205_39890 [Bacillus velezensis]ANS40335.1 hypothetical protein A5891_18905 [Bacillus velezensis]ANU32094.1 hypothetical protein A8142_18780 [Bacillus velezensis]APQ50697.1 hypothetical protein BSO20_12090 [Bacillus amyloliquefaciens]